MNRAVFFDRDGVINKLIFRKGNYYSPREINNFKLYNDTTKVIKTVKDKGYLSIIISNQPDIARGLLKKTELNKMTKYLYNKLKVDDILYCMHDDPDVKGCRKPAAGLIIKAKNKWNISLQHSFMIGDTEKDLGAAKNAGVKFLLINRNYNENINVSDRINKLTDITLYLD